MISVDNYTANSENIPSLSMFDVSQPLIMESSEMGNTPNVQPSTMFIRDNLEIMRGIDSECIDLIYLDPPFNSKCNYAAPIGSEAAGAEFKDMWSLDDVDAQWISMIADEHPRLHTILKAVPDDSDKSYLVYMAIRLLEMHRILKDTGSLYLHCDPTMDSWLRIVLDAIFGKRNFRNQIIWYYTNSGGRGQRNFAKKHDVIFRMSKTNDFFFDGTKDGQKRAAGDSSKGGKIYEEGGKLYQQIWSNKKSYTYCLSDDRIADDVWSIQPIPPHSKERVGYPTQKPLPLLERIIKTSSNEGDWVLDPFCGCATTCVAAHMLGRKWIGIDVSPAAEILVRKRIDRELRNDWVSSGQPVYEPISTGDIPVQSGAKVNPREYKRILYGEQQGNCNLCGVHFEFRNLTIDHIVPKSKGGQDLEGNLQLLCQACNSEKGVKAMAEMQALFSSYKPTRQTISV